MSYRGPFVSLKVIYSVTGKSTPVEISSPRRIWVYGITERESQLSATKQQDSECKEGRKVGTRGSWKELEGKRGIAGAI